MNKWVKRKKREERRKEIKRKWLRKQLSWNREFSRIWKWRTCKKPRKSFSEWLTHNSKGSTDAYGTHISPQRPKWNKSMEIKQRLLKALRRGRSSDHEQPFSPTHMSHSVLGEFPVHVTWMPHSQEIWLYSSCNSKSLFYLQTPISHICYNIQNLQSAKYIYSTFYPPFLI